MSRSLASFPTLRTFDHRCVWQMEPAQFLRAAEMVTAHEARYQPELVIGVARGGLPLAREFSKRLGVGMVEVTARHNRSDAVYVQASGQVEISDLRRSASQIPAGLRVLVADDICGSGATLAALLPPLQRMFAPALVRRAVLCRNAAAPPDAVDVWMWETRDWVVFPWDEPPGCATEALVEPRLHTAKVAR